MTVPGAQQSDGDRPALRAVCKSPSVHHRRTDRRIRIGGHHATRPASTAPLTHIGGELNLDRTRSNRLLVSAGRSSRGIVQKQDGRYGPDNWRSVTATPTTRRTDRRRNRERKGMASATVYHAQVALARRLDGLSLVQDTLELEAEELRLISLIRPPRLRERFEALTTAEIRILRAGSGQLRKSNGVLDQLEHELSGKEKDPQACQGTEGQVRGVIATTKHTTPSEQMSLFGDGNDPF